MINAYNDPTNPKILTIKEIDNVQTTTPIIFINSINAFFRNAIIIELVRDTKDKIIDAIIVGGNKYI